MKKSMLLGLIGLALVGLTTFSAYAGEVNVTFRNSSNAGIQGATVQRIVVTNGNDGAPGLNRTTDANGVAATYILNEGNYKFRISWNNMVYTTDVYAVQAVGNIDVDIYTSNIVFRSLSANDEEVGDVTARFRHQGGNTWRSFGTTDNSGTANKEMLPGDYEFQGEYQYTSNVQNKTFTTNFNAGETDTVKSYLTKVSMNAIGGANTPIKNVIGKHRAIGSTTWRTLGTADVNGLAVNYMYPDDYEFRAEYQYTDYERIVTVTGTGNSPVGTAMDLDVYLTEVTFQGFNGDGSIVTNGMAGQYKKVGQTTWRTFGTTEANGEKVNYLLPGNFDFRGSYKYTSFDRVVAISGNTESAQFQNIPFYLTQVNISAISVNNEKVAGLTTQYYPQGSSTIRSGGSTDVNGENALNLFPGTHTLRNTINHTYIDTLLEVTGNTLAVQEINLPLSISKVKFTNQGSVAYLETNSSTYRTVAATGTYIHLGVHKFRFTTKGATNTNTNYTRDVNVNNINFDRSVAVIKLINNAGNPIAINSSRGGVASINWHVNNAVSDQSSSIWIDVSGYNTNTNRIYEVTKNSTTATKTQDVMTNNVFIFQTNTLTVRLQKCNGDGIEGGTMRVGSSADLATVPSISRHWNAMEVSSANTDTEGNSSVEVFPNRFVVEMKTGTSTQEKDFVLTGNDTIIWNTTNVKLNYPGEIAYGKGSVSGFFTKPTSAYGQMELLPGTLKISFRNSGENIVDFEILETECANIEKTAVIARLVNSTNAPLSGGIVRYYQGTWYYNQATTAANGNGVILLNGNAAIATVAMDYLGAVQQKSNVNLTSLTNNTIIWQTIPVTLTLKDQDGFPLEADNGSVQFYAGSSWKPFADGNITGGATSMELLPVAHSYAMKLNGTTQQFSNATATTIEFTAKKLHIYYQNDCNPVSGANTSYYAGSWRSLGTTDANGNSKAIDLLPGGTISIKVGTAPQINGVTITAHPDQVVTVGECVRTD